MKINFHQHSTGSDGKSSPEEVIKEAISRKINHICFTDHYKRPKETLDKNWNDSGFHNFEYRALIKTLKEKYAKQITISFGVELDWVEGYEDWKKQVSKQEFDFVIGSIHVLQIDGEWTAIDDNEKTWVETVDKLGGIGNLVRLYYTQLRKMISSGLYDAVGHLDIIKIYNKDERFFSESSDWYMREVLETLDEVKKSGMCIEINTSGFRKTVGVQYPSEWILREALMRNIPITIGTDGHHADYIDFMLEEAYELAKKVGYKSILVFEKRKSREVKI